MDTGELPTQYMLRSQHPEAVRSGGYRSEDIGQMRMLPPQKGVMAPINFDDPSPLPPSTAYFGHNAHP